LTVSGSVVNAFINEPFLADQLELWYRHATYDEFVDRADVDAKGTFSFYLTIGMFPETEYQYRFDQYSMPSPRSNAEELYLQQPRFFFKLKKNNNFIDYTLDFEQEAFVIRRFFSIEELNTNVTLYVDEQASEPEAPKKIAAKIKKTGEEEYFNNVKVDVSLELGGWPLETWGTIELGIYRTGYEGLFGWQVPKTNMITYYDRNYQGQHKFVFDIYDEDDNHLTKVEYPISGSVFEIVYTLIVEIDISLEEPSSSKSIEELVGDLGIEVSTDVKEYLQGYDILTLEDIRLSGGLNNHSTLQGSPYDNDQDQNTIHLLDGHARLELVSDNYSLNQHAVDVKGYTSPIRISNAPRSSFVKDMMERGTINEYEAARMHRVAQMVAGYQQQQLIGFMAGDRQLSSETEQELATDAQIDRLQDQLDNLIDEKCSCEDCDAAVSPFAYLVDLLNYVQGHVFIYDPNALVWSGTISVSPEVLSEIFCQPFSCLPQECDELKSTICQYRIAVEVLHCYRQKVSPTYCQQQNFDREVDKYLNNAYFTLLQQFGTTYEQIRDNFHATPQDREDLADNLGIVPTHHSVQRHNNGETIKEMHLDPSADSGNYEITAERLENIFGLRSFEYSPYDDCADDGQFSDLDTPKILK